MSWSDDIRCLHCDGRLPLYRKITHGQFCSNAHRKAYWQEQERLAVERLHQTHDSLQAYRDLVPVDRAGLPAQPSLESGLEIAPPMAAPLPLSGLTSSGLTSAGSVLATLASPTLASTRRPKPSFRPAVLVPEDWGEPEKQLQKPVATEPPWAGFLRAPLPSVPVRWTGGIVWADEVSGLLVPEPPIAQPAADLALSLSALTYEEPQGDVLEPEVSAEQDLPWAGFVLPPVRSAAPQTGAAMWDDELSAPLALTSTWPIHAESRETGEMREPAALEPLWAGLLAADIASRAPAGTATQVRQDESPDLVVAAPSIVTPVAELTLAPLPEIITEPDAPESEVDAPFADRLCRLAPAPQVDARSSFVLAAYSAALFPQRAFLPLSGERLQAGLENAAKVETDLPSSRARNLLLTPPLEAVGVEALEAQAASPATPRLGYSLPVELQLHLAGPGGYTFQPELAIPAQAPAGAQKIEVQSIPLNAAGGEVAIVGANLVPAGSFGGAEVPLSTTLLPLLLNGKPKDQPLRAAASNQPGSVIALYALPQPPKIEPALPRTGCEPLDAKPVADEFPSDFSAPAPFPAPNFDASVALRQVPSWKHVAGFWKQAPRDLRMLVIAIPALIALVFHPFALPKVSVRAPQNSGIEHVLGAQLANVKQSLVDRAAVALDEDFRSGLDGWVSRGNATAAWSFDATGFVQPGPLALYQPSMALSDYQMLFLGMIDHKALSWVVRASDFRNYYVIKLVVLKDGPLPQIGLTRYAVIDGKAQDRSDAIVPVSARPDMLYRVRVDVSGDDFVLDVQGQVVDAWTEPRLHRGGIGFFSARGEQSRVRWVQVTHQYDMLGRLCAYLAPYNIPTNGSW